MDQAWYIDCSNGKLKLQHRFSDHFSTLLTFSCQGPSGAGKTSLLDVLATRATTGIISGNAYVDGLSRDTSFQRKTGYAQQQDLHLETMTVREALQFNALMCQSRDIPKKEKLEYVEEVIKLLRMNFYADAVIGVPGQGKSTSFVRSSVEGCLSYYQV